MKLLKGRLYGEYGGKETTLYCPFRGVNNRGEMIACGTWCPLFILKTRIEKSTNKITKEIPVSVELKCGYSAGFNLEDEVKDEKAP